MAGSNTIHIWERSKTRDNAHGRDLRQLALWGAIALVSGCAELGEPVLEDRDHAAPKQKGVLADVAHCPFPQQPFAKILRGINSLTGCPSITSEELDGPTYHIGSSFFDARTYLFFSDADIPQRLRDQIVGKVPAEESAIVSVEESAELRALNTRCPGFLTAPEFADEAFKNFTFGPQYFEVGVLGDEDGDPVLLVLAEWHKKSGIAYVLWTKTCQARVVARGVGLSAPIRKPKGKTSKRSLSIYVNEDPSRAWLSGACRQVPPFGREILWAECSGEAWLQKLAAGAGTLVPNVRSSSEDISLPTSSADEAWWQQFTRYSVGPETKFTGNQGLCESFVRDPKIFTPLVPGHSGSVPPNLTYQDVRGGTYVTVARKEYRHRPQVLAFQDLNQQERQFLRLVQLGQHARPGRPSDQGLRELQEATAAVDTDYAENALLTVWDSPILRAMEARCPGFLWGPVLDDPSSRALVEQYGAGNIKTTMDDFSIYDLRNKIGISMHLIERNYYGSFANELYALDFNRCQSWTPKGTIIKNNDGQYFIVRLKEDSMSMDAVNANDTPPQSSLPLCEATGLKRASN